MSLNESLDWLIHRCNTPLGEMLLVTDPQGILRALDYWEDSQHSILADLGRLYGTDRITLTSGPLPTLKNPIGIVVPCHRVIGSNGTLTGYAGGIDRKRWLLQHEGALS